MDRVVVGRQSRGHASFKAVRVGGLYRALGQALSCSNNRVGIPPNHEGVRWRDGYWNLVRYVNGQEPPLPQCMKPIRLTDKSLRKEPRFLELIAMNIWQARRQGAIIGAAYVLGVELRISLRTLGLSIQCRRSSMQVLPL